MALNRLKAIIKKEVKQLLRDKRFLFVLFFFPVFLLGMFGYAVNFDVHHIKLGVLDKDESAQSREFIHSLTTSSYFDLVQYISNESEIQPLIDNQRVQLVMVIPDDFSKQLEIKGAETEIQFLIDGVNGNTASIINNYVTAATMSYNTEIQSRFFESIGRKPVVPLNLEARFWYNPDLETTKFLIPGLIALILIVTAVISVSLSLVREKERGTIEQIKVSSIKSFEMLVGKAIPYVTIALMNGILILIAGRILFGLEVSGSYLLLLFTTFLFLYAGINLGIFVSAVADSQQVAFTMAVFISLLPSFILSGFVFPIDSMPEAIQILTNITPAKFYISAIRGIILKGVGFSAIYDQLLYLLLYATIFLLLALGISIKKEKEA